MIFASSKKKPLHNSLNAKVLNLWVKLNLLLNTQQVVPLNLILLLFSLEQKLFVSTSTPALRHHTHWWEQTKATAERNKKNLLLSAKTKTAIINLFWTGEKREKNLITHNTKWPQRKATLVGGGEGERGDKRGALSYECKEENSLGFNIHSFE